MTAVLAGSRDYLGAITRTAQYLAGLTADREVWQEFGKILSNFFGTDIVAFVESRPGGELSVHYCHSTDGHACAYLKQLSGVVAQVSESGFLATETLSLPENYAFAFLPLTTSSRTSMVIAIGHKNSGPLSKTLLDIYLAVTGLFETTLARIMSERRLRSMADNVPEMLYQMVRYPDGTTRFTYVSKGARGVLGLAPDELLREAALFDAGLHPDERAEYEQALAAAGKEPQRLYQSFRWLGGGEAEVKYILLNAMPSNQSDGSVVWDGAIQDITERKRSEEALRRVNRALKTLSSCNMALVHAESENQLLEAICRIIVNVGGYHVAWAGLVGKEGFSVMAPMVKAGPGDRLEIQERFELDRAQLCGCLAGEAIASGQPQVVQYQQPGAACEHCRAEAERLGVVAGASFPLHRGTQILGALTIYAVESGAFDQEELKLLDELASDLAFGIRWLRTRAEREQLDEERKRYHARLEQGMEATIQAIAATIEMRDPYTAGHQRRVADLAMHIARELGLPEEEITGIFLAATIHDIGKIHIPAEILSYPGKLPSIEYALIQMHPMVGYEILKGVEFPWPLAEFVRQHHERLDGSGYPQQLKGEQILLGARIISVADVVEAITTHRPYRPALGIDEALAEITRNSGTLYEPDVVNACVRLFRDKGYSLPDK